VPLCLFASLSIRFPAVKDGIGSYCIVISLVFASYLSPLKAQEKPAGMLQIHDISEVEYADLQNTMLFFADTAANLTVPQVRKADFQKKTSFQAKPAYWGKLELDVNLSVDKEWIMRFGDRLNCQYLDLYVFQGDSLRLHRRGGTFATRADLSHLSDRFAFPFTTLRQERVQLFFRFQSIMHHPVYPQVSVEQAVYGQNREKRHDLIQLFLQGGLVLTMLYHLLLYFVLGFRSYLWYACYSLSLIMLFAFQFHYLVTYVIFDFPRIGMFVNAAACGFILLSYLLFFESFFHKTPAYRGLRPLFRLLKGISWFNLIANQLILLFFFDIQASENLILACTLTQLLIIPYLLFKLYDPLYKPGVLVIGGSFILLIVSVITVTIMLFIVNHKINWTLEQATMILEVGVLLELGCFALALGLRGREAYQQRRIAQQQIIDMQKETNIVLEKTVKDRTYELEMANEELTSQKEEIQAMNEGLEFMIHKRTAELQEAMEDILQKNKDLQQFSYIISHNVRSPVAHMLGLSGIFNYAQPEDELNREILLKMREASQMLDTTLKDLNDILSIRDGEVIRQEKVSLPELLLSITRTLEEEIETSGAEILSDFSEVSSVETVKPYFQSVLYNLVSNAIKYRSPERRPVVTVRAKMNGKFVRISVKDNGLGMDMAGMDSYKIFGLYQRMHTHTEGKGLGLYMVKTQIEALRGKVEVESQKNKGSIFRIYLPLS
jgi:signal transduction histidine kinase